MPEDRTPSGVADPDTTLRQEQAFLAKARDDLATMRERVLALEAVGGDAISDGYLAATLEQRARALVDNPDVPLFFGRIDTGSGRWHIGRRHVQDQVGEPVVVDWRADVSLAFYRATRTEPMGVGLRRRYGFEGGRLTAYEDEHLTDSSETARRSAILAGEIERPRTGPMRDIVATIQPEQDALVRADLDESLCIQGAPGTGKTAVGLHRIAFLVYTFRERLRRSGVLVIGPNRAFLSYIAQVLPALGEYEVEQTTVEQLTGVDRLRLRADESAEVAQLKGDARMATVLRRAVWSHVRPPTEALVVTLGSRRWRVPTSQAARAVDALRERDVRYGAGRAVLGQRLAHEVLVAMERQGMVTDDRDQDRVARTRDMKAYVDTIWPRLDATKLVMRLLGEEGLLEDSAQGVLTPEEITALRWAKPARGPASARWAPADTVLIDEVADLIERTPSLGHVVLDEAQDLSPMQLRAVGRRASTGSITVLGDLAQGTTTWAATSWPEALAHLGHPRAQIADLTRGFRVPAAVIDFAARLLPHLDVQLDPPTSVRDDPGMLQVVPAQSLSESVVAACQAVLGEPGSVGVICADAVVSDVAGWLVDAALAPVVLGEEMTYAADLTVVPATLAKGLEFDHVVVVEPAAIATAEPRGLNRLYVVLTRAVSSLTVVHEHPLPPELASG